MVFKGQPVKSQPIEFGKYSHCLLMCPFKIDRQTQLQKPLFEPINSEWTVTEIARYSAFSLHNKKQIEESPQSVLWGLYKEMSQFIETRNFRQCKNYHCKLMKQWKKLNAIIEHFKSAFNSFSQQLRKQRQRIKNFYQQKQHSPLPKNGFKQNANKNQSVTSANYDIIMPMTSVKECSNPLRIQFNGMNFKEPSSIGLCEQGGKKSIQEQWIQCHELFLEWTQRLKQLNQMNINF